MTKPVCAIIGIGPKNGAAFARRFSAEGYALALLSRSTGYSEELAGELGDAHAYACDAGDPDSVAAAFKQVHEDLGDVDRSTGTEALSDGRCARGRRVWRKRKASRRRKARRGARD